MPGRKMPRRVAIGDFVGGQMCALVVQGCPNQFSFNPMYGQFVDSTPPDGKLPDMAPVPCPVSLYAL